MNCNIYLADGTLLEESTTDDTVRQAMSEVYNKFYSLCQLGLSNPHNYFFKYKTNHEYEYNTGIRSLITSIQSTISTLKHFSDIKKLVSSYAVYGDGSKVTGCMLFIYNSEYFSLQLKNKFRGLEFNKNTFEDMQDIIPFGPDKGISILSVALGYLKVEESEKFTLELLRSKCIYHDCPTIFIKLLSNNLGVFHKIYDKFQYQLTEQDFYPYSEHENFRMRYYLLYNIMPKAINCNGYKDGFFAIVKKLLLSSLRILPAAEFTDEVHTYLQRYINNATHYQRNYKELMELIRARNDFFEYIDNIEHEKFDFVELNKKHDAFYDLGYNYGHYDMIRLFIRLKQPKGLRQIAKDYEFDLAVLGNNVYTLLDSLFVGIIDIKASIRDKNLQEKDFHELLLPYCKLIILQQSQDGKLEYFNQLICAWLDKDYWQKCNEINDNFAKLLLSETDPSKLQQLFIITLENYRLKNKVESLSSEVETIKGQLQELNLSKPCDDNTVNQPLLFTATTKDTEPLANHSASFKNG